jgi:hypothetical protein
MFLSKKSATFSEHALGVTLTAAWLMQRPVASARVIGFYAYVE